MPKLEPKQIQKELEQGLIWPVYWIYGQERMKSRELLKRIKTAALGTNPTAGLAGFSNETFDGSESSGSAVADAAQSMALGGGIRFIIVRDAHELDDADEITSLFSPRTKKEELPWVCVFLSKDLDMRKKLSKQLIENAAVVSCEEVPEQEREAWIEYLAKLRGIQLDARAITLLRSLDPWNLEIIDQELEKFSLAGESGTNVLLASSAQEHATERFIDALFTRNQAVAASALDSFANTPEESIPLLGLLGWNLRQLALAVADASNPSAPKGRPNPYLAEKLRRWTPHWDFSSLMKLQDALAELDYSSKQTPKHPTGLWMDLVIEACKMSRN